MVSYAQAALNAELKGKQMTGIAQALEDATARTKLLTKQAGIRAAEKLELNKQLRLAKYALRRDALVTRNKRMARALQGLKALLQFGENPQVQELLAAQDSISIYSQNDVWIDSAVYLAKDGIYVEAKSYGIRWGQNDSLLGRGKLDSITSWRLFFAYGVEDDLVCAKQLEPIFCRTRYTLVTEDIEDEDDLQMIRAQNDDAPEDDLMFQVLVDCADPLRFERYIKRALH
ncbi:MAG: hypothetical protein V4644_02860 [Patescibacteria group bacterium]